MMQTIVSKKDTCQPVFDPSILRAYDIRGVVGETLHHEDALHLGKSFASHIIRESGKSDARIALVYDGRLSTPDLRSKLIEGLTSTGAQVEDYGLGPTPSLYHAVHRSNADGGIMITGSHNPASHNGFKMMRGKASVFGDEIQTLGEIANRGDYVTGSGSITSKSLKTEYLADLLSAYKADGSEPLKVAFDPGNGSAGEITQQLAERLPGEHVVINAEIDGNFPAHHPDPTVPANMQQLIQTVKEQGCDFGIAFDGDGDRIGAVDKTGRILFGDQLMILFSRDLLTRHPGATIIADVKASQTLFEDISAHGGTPLMWKTGHSLVKSKMKETGAKLAGEMSGHIFFADDYYGYDDGLYAAVRLINLVAHSSDSLETMIDSLPACFSTPEIRIDVPEAEKFAMVEAIEQELAKTSQDVSTVDGVRVNTDDGWWLMRASNTQPALVVRAESQNEEALARLKETLKSQLRKAGVTSLPDAL